MDPFWLEILTEINSRKLFKNCSKVQHVFVVIERVRKWKRVKKKKTTKIFLALIIHFYKHRCTSPPPLPQLQVFQCESNLINFKSGGSWVLPSENRQQHVRWINAQGNALVHLFFAKKDDHLTNTSGPISFPICDTREDSIFCFLGLVQFFLQENVENLFNW